MSRKEINCDFCPQKSTYEIRGTKLCAEHAVEALEHGADFTNDFTDLRFTKYELQNALLNEAQITRRISAIKRYRRIKLEQELSPAQLEFVKKRRAA